MGGITCQEELSPTGLLTTVSYEGVSLVASMGSGSLVDKRLLWQQRMLPSPQVGSALPDSAHWLEQCHRKLHDRPHETQGRTVSSRPAKTVLGFHACFLSCLTQSYVTLTDQSPMPCYISRCPRAGRCLSDKGSWRSARLHPVRTLPFQLHAMDFDFGGVPPGSTSAHHVL